MHPAWSNEPSALDRAAHLRESVDLSELSAIVTTGDSVLMDGSRLVRVAAGMHPPALEQAFLGVAADEQLAVVVPDPTWTPPAATEFVPLRNAYQRVRDFAEAASEREIASAAVAMANWHLRHGWCGTCGARTEPREGGWVRRCTEGEHDHYPRTDPAVIVAITDEEDRLLLAHVSYHSPRRYSHLAGYVEPGETLEQAAVREVHEEASLRLTDLSYVGSQPWPFPASIMVAFTGRAAAKDLQVDGVEVTDARFFTRGELAAQVVDGNVLLAPEGSIARALIHEWNGGPIGDRIVGAS